MYCYLALPAGVTEQVYSLETTPLAEARRNQSRAVLWTCLDVYTRLLHPMCPFVTEELWQRLPGRGTGCSDGEQASIMVSAWPRAVPAWHSPAAELGMEVALGAIEGARSLRADHHLAKKPAAFCVVCATPDAYAAVAAQADDVATLCGALGAVAVVDASRRGPPGVSAHGSAPGSAHGGGGGAEPAGWPQKIVSDAVKVFVDLAAFAAAAAADGKTGIGSGGGSSGSGGDAAEAKAKQVGKLAKEAAKLAPLIAKLQAKLEDPAYAAKVPAATQAKDREKLDQYAKMHADATDAIKNLA
jgi:valyl-tRNA synthetase